MPHLIVRHFTPPQTPYQEESGLVRFLFGSLDPHLGIVGVQADDHTFLLRWFPHASGTILKVDKATRPPDLNTVKKSLKALAHLGGSEILHSTIETFRPEQRFEALVDADHFVNRPIDRPLWLEVGFGSGRHMLHNARQHPDCLHLGLEIHRPSAEQLLRRCEDEGLENILVACADARIVVQTLPSQSVERIFVHFPVPWDKAPHRRVFSQIFIESAARILAPGGRLELRTDSAEYFRYAFDLLEALNQSERIVRKNHEAGVSSKYEDRWRKQQKDIYDLIYINNLTTAPKRPWYDFGFKGPQAPGAIDTLRQHMDQAWLEEGALLKPRALWFLGETRTLLQVTMGAFDAPQTLYLMLDEHQVRYFPATPLPTAENHTAHRILEGVICGR